jgi:hypothetical protein
MRFKPRGTLLIESLAPLPPLLAEALNMYHQNKDAYLDIAQSLGKHLIRISPSAKRNHLKMLLVTT